MSTLKAFKTYTIAWIASTRSDEIAALTLLDANDGAPLEDRDPTAGDACTYTTGLMAGHKVVLVCMHADLPQPFTADNIVHNMRYTFLNLRFAMLLGVGSAIPKYKCTSGLQVGCGGGVRDVRLGDVVVGCQKGKKKGVVYEVHNNGPVQTRKVINRPSSVTMALARLESQRAHLGWYIEQSLGPFGQYARPANSSDHLPRFLVKDASKIPPRTNTSSALSTSGQGVEGSLPASYSRALAPTVSSNSPTSFQDLRKVVLLIFPSAFSNSCSARRTTMSLLSLPPELLSCILTYCIPRDRDGEASISLWDHDGEADLRLVCHKFDSMWSHGFIWEILNRNRSQRYNLKTIHESWPVDSTIWIVRTILVMRYGLTSSRLKSPTRNDNEDNPSVLEYIYAMVEASSGILPKIQPDEDRVGVIARAIARVAKALVLNHEFKDIVTELVPHSEGSGISRGVQADENEELTRLSWEINPADIFSLLCLSCSAQVIEQFLSKEGDVDVNRRHPLFGSALYNAAATNNADVVKLLLGKGADVNGTGGRWHTPLHASVAYPRGTGSLTLLIAAGANVNAQPAYSVHEGRTPLITASHARNTEAVSILLAHKNIDITIPAMSDESIAHYIARAGDAANLRLLLELHPDVNIKLKGEYGTPLHTAMNLAWDQLTEGHDAVVEILLERGLSPNDTCPGAERDVVGWAEEVMNEAREEGEEVPAAAVRVLRWWEEYVENVIGRRREGRVR
ncbi:hypothetical protein BJX65DRAFT_301998 [Aspergillus insuetus]